MKMVFIDARYNASMVARLLPHCSSLSHCAFGVASLSLLLDASGATIPATQCICGSLAHCALGVACFSFLIGASKKAKVVSRGVGIPCRKPLACLNNRAPSKFAPLQLRVGLLLKMWWLIASVRLRLHHEVAAAS